MANIHNINKQLYQQLTTSINAVNLREHNVNSSVYLNYDDLWNFYNKLDCLFKNNKKKYGNLFTNILITFIQYFEIKTGNKIQISEISATLCSDTIQFDVEDLTYEYRNLELKHENHRDDVIEQNILSEEKFEELYGQKYRKQEQLIYSELEEKQHLMRILEEY